MAVLRLSLLDSVNGYKVLISNGLGVLVDQSRASWNRLAAWLVHVDEIQLMDYWLDRA